jgi:hypothetical protein
MALPGRSERNEPGTVGERRSRELLPYERAAGLLARPAVLLVTTLVLSLVVSALIGADANWDLRNYHYYNGRALVTWSLFDDVAPAGLQTYLHPLIDVPIYWFSELFGMRVGLVLWTGLLQWACLFGVWRLTGALPPLRDSFGRRAVAMVVVMSGAGAASLAFTTFGDWVVAAFICESLGRLLRAMEGGAPTARATLWAGVFLGLAVGVKPTAAGFALALTLGALAGAGFRVAWRLAAGAAASAAVYAGPWMIYLWWRFGNPVFPFFNRVFRSASAPSSSNFDDGRYGSATLLDVLNVPVDLARGTIKYSELLIRDWRFVALLVVIAVRALFAPALVPDAWRRSPVVRTIGVFLAVGYLLWILQFGIYRYFLVEEIVVSVVLTAVVADWVHTTHRVAAVACSLVLVGIGYQTYPAWGRGDIGAEVEPFKQAVATMPTPPRRVVFGTGPPLAYLSYGLPTSARFASLYPYASHELVLAGQLREDLDSFIADGLAAHSLYVVLDADSSTLAPPLDQRQLGACAPFVSFDRSLQICEVL